MSALLRSETVPLQPRFALRALRDGLWAVDSVDGRSGGLFATLEAAERFVRGEERARIVRPYQAPAPERQTLALTVIEGRASGKS